MTKYEKAMVFASGWCMLALPMVAMTDEKAELSGGKEVPAVSTTGVGEFRAKISDGKIEYELSYSNLEGNVLQAHIHFAQSGANGGVSAFLCTNLGNFPGAPTCPGSTSGTVTGVIEASDVIGPSAQGISAGEFSKLVRAIEDGLTYINVHTDQRPSGEIRGQVR